MKSGIKTTEFWLTAGKAVAAIAVAVAAYTGAGLDEAQLNDQIETAVRAVVAIVALGAGAFCVRGYTRDRADLKANDK